MAIAALLISTRQQYQIGNPKQRLIDQHRTAHGRRIFAKRFDSANLELLQLNLQPPSLDQRIAPTPLYGALIFDCDGTLADTLPVTRRNS